MWKKILWIYVVLYAIGTVILAFTSGAEGEPILSMIPGLIVMLIPAGILVFELRDGKSPNIFVTILLIIAYLISLLFLAVASAGIIAFDVLAGSIDIMYTLSRVLLIIPMLLCILYFGFKRVFRRKK